MIELIDFTNSTISNRDLQYAGRAGEKRGIVLNGEYWFLKFPKNTIGMKKVNELSYVTSPLSEYIGSHIFKILGFDVHDTKLGVFNDGNRFKVVCACKDFIIDDKNEILVPYTALRNDTNPVVMARNEDNLQSASNINEIVFQLRNNTVLGNIKDAYRSFFEVAIVDILINNNDRNEDNWGVIKNKSESKYSLAPVYDCGNCFYSKTSESRIESLLEDKARLQSSAINCTTAYEDDNENRMSIIDLIKMISTNDLKILENMANIIESHLDEIVSFIYSIPSNYKDIVVMSRNRKLYYIKTIFIRFNYLKESILAKHINDGLSDLYEGKVVEGKKLLEELERKYGLK